MNEFSPDLSPIELRVAAQGAALLVAWSDGTATALAAPILRQACRCAACVAAPAGGADATATGANVAIVVVEPVGAYAVNIAFSDGHARGIYPWSLLRELGGDP